MSKISEVAIAEARMLELNDADIWSLTEVEQEVLRSEYRDVRAVLLAYYGEDADCSKVDPWSLDSYAAVYKSHYGFNPTILPSYKNAHALLAMEIAKDEDDRFDPDISTWTDEAQDYQDRTGSSPFAELANFVCVKQ